MKNIRSSITDLDDDALRASLTLFGWKKDLPAIQDQDGDTVIGHRRLRLAKQLGIEPVIKSHHFKDDTERRELQVASNVGFSEMTKEDRVKVAQAMLADNPTLTLEEIAIALDVSKATISRDLNLIVSSETIKKPAKTTRNPKGAGRHKGVKTPSAAPPKPAKSKGTSAPKPHSEAIAVIALHDKGRTQSEIAAETGVSQRQVRHILEEEAILRKAQAKIDPATLSMTAQQKLDLAIKQATHKLEIEIEQRVRAKVQRWLNDDLLPLYRKKEQTYNLMIAKRKGIMKRPEYRAILSCLHPDRVQDADLKKRFEHAFNIFSKLEKIVLDEKESPTLGSDLPTTMEGWMKRRAEYEAKRAAERAARKGSTANVARR